MIAGTGARGFSGDGGPAARATFDGPTGLSVDASGTVYVADSNNHRVRRIKPDGTIDTLAGSGALVGDGVPADSAVVWVIDVGGHRRALDHREGIELVALP